MNLIVGSKIRILRKNKNLSQEQVADYLCISQSAYARMESGESHSWANHIFKICKIFEVSPSELFNENNVDSISEKAIEQYEEKIRELKQVINDLKKVGMSKK